MVLVGAAFAAGKKRPHSRPRFIGPHPRPVNYLAAFAAGKKRPRFIGPHSRPEISGRIRGR